MPLATGLIGPDGADMELVLDDGSHLDSGILEVRSAKQSWTFTGITQRPVLSINRGFSAPINLTTGQRDDELLFLMANDRDAFNRWEAGQTLSRSIIMAAMQAIGDGDDPAPIDEYADALATILASGELEAAFKAQMLALPSEADIANMVGRNVDPRVIMCAPPSAHCCRTSLRAWPVTCLQAITRRVPKPRDSARWPMQLLRCWLPQGRPRLEQQRWSGSMVPGTCLT